MKKWTVYLLLLFFSINSYSQNDLIETTHAAYTCGAETLKGASFKYCYKNQDVIHSKDIVFFLHGLEGNEKTWFTQPYGTAALEKIWNHWGYHPAVVTVSFGDVWLLVDNSRYKLLPYFEKVVVPFLENKVGYSGQGRRLLIGQSMGGLNASIASLKLPGLFKKVALLCPAITNIGPYSSPKAIQDYITRTNADTTHVQKMLSLSKQVFEDQADWYRHDPLHLIKKYEGLKSKYFISTGVIDEYGFQEGAEIFKILSNRYHFRTKFIPAPGVHCDFDRLLAASFIYEGAQ